MRDPHKTSAWKPK